MNAPAVSERVNELTDCFSADTFPSLQRRGGCGINKKARSLRSAADGVVSSAKLFRPKDFADLLLRLRPIGLASAGWECCAPVVRLFLRNVVRFAQRLRKSDSPTPYFRISPPIAVPAD